MNKTQRYDRQLRLWKEHGQKELETAKICLLNADATGTETLKNLVLPGIGSITIVDGEKVSESDLGSNFFVSASSIGMSRAKCTIDCLKELNEDVETLFNEEDPRSLIQNHIDFFQDFRLVIASNMTRHELKPLADYLWTRGIPLMIVRSYGFVGYLRIIVPELARKVAETHPESNIDLRIDAPFQSLKDFADSFDFEKLDSMQKSHVPYVVILLKCLEIWKSTYGAPPSTYQEKQVFKKIINQLEGDGVEEVENFDEARANAYRAWTITKIPDSTAEILKDSKCDQINEKTLSFWIMARALRDFVETEGQLPLVGTVPDMKADTESYVRLQTIYRSTSQSQIRWIYQRVSQICSQINREIDFEEVERFCKHAAHLKVLRYPSLESDDSQLNSRRLDIVRRIEESDNCLIFLLLLRAVDIFHETQKRYPGLHKHDIDSDTARLRRVMSVFLSSIGIQSAVPDEYIQEMVRFGAVELHNVAAFMGGVSSQEVIKVLTKQYVPVFHTMVFDGTKGTCSVFDY